jgi:methylthioribose-1-phosphate isomerase
MKINGKKYHSVWKQTEDSDTIEIIDQRFLPHQLIFEQLDSSEKVAVAIEEMHLRGAPLIGIVAAFGIYYAYKEADKNDDFLAKVERIQNTRPTAINLEWAIQQQLKLIESQGDSDKQTILNNLFENGFHILNEDIELCRKIGENALSILEDIAAKKPGETINILTHCNAGWLATGDYGTATSPIYQAHDKGLKVHVYVDETRPRNQGARLTAWELSQHGIPHTVIADNTGGHLMQHGLVDVCFVGADRVTRSGDAANKIGTYLKALAAKDNNVPFYVCLPYTTFDFSITDGVKEIPIEERGSEEVKLIQGKTNGEVLKVLLTPEQSPAVNYGFDVTPARLITGIVTERGQCAATEDSIMNLYTDHS